MNRIQILLRGAVLATASMLAAFPIQAETLAVVAGDKTEALRQSADDAIRAVADVDQRLAHELGDRVRAAVKQGQDAREQFAALQRALDPACLLEVHINPESRVKVAAGPAETSLEVGKVLAFLVKVHNMAGVTAPLQLSCRQAIRDSQPAADAWLEIEMHDADGVPSELGGSLVEYRVVKLRTDESGDRAAVVAMDVGQGTADIGFRNDVLLTFRCKAPAETPGR